MSTVWFQGLWLFFPLSHCPSLSAHLLPAPATTFSCWEIHPQDTLVTYICQAVGRRRERKNTQSAIISRQFYNFTSEHTAHDKYGRPELQVHSDWLVMLMMICCPWALFGDPSIPHSVAEDLSVSDLVLRVAERIETGIFPQRSHRQPAEGKAHT